ncbi:hypothetical protein L484_011640 [Morus notabilis]|uniref:Uncharacterized protein n=1 Tax=Morus notabilis TaxID=981085 RepID=W9RF67_9ROSA|nr:hypothetical protein L484_011640 [Morus notabilis]
MLDLQCCELVHFVISCTGPTSATSIAVAAAAAYAATASMQRRPRTDLRRTRLASVSMRPCVQPSLRSGLASMLLAHKTLSGTLRALSGLLRTMRGALSAMFRALPAMCGALCPCFMVSGCKALCAMCGALPTRNGNLTCEYPPLKDGYEDIK